MGVLRWDHGHTGKHLGAGGDHQSGRGGLVLREQRTWGHWDPSSVFAMAVSFCNAWTSPHGGLGQETNETPVPHSERWC